MTVFDEWLKKHRPDCPELDRRLKGSIAYFVLIWSYFEQQIIEPADARLLRKSAEANKPHEATNYDRIEEAAANGLGDFTATKEFIRAFAYFSDRHLELEGANISSHLEELTQEATNSRNRIQQVFRDDPDDYTQRIAALLHVAYCLRTNLIHGFKWHSGLVGQEVNFNHASQVLMLAVDHPQNPVEV